MTTSGPFSGRSAVWLVAIGGTAFVAILLSQIFGDRLGVERSHRSDATSVSAIGTRAFMRVLERVGMPTARLSADNMQQAGDGAVAVITDPTRTFGTEEQRRKILEGADRAILVMPKWTGPPGSMDRRWIGPVRRDSLTPIWTAIVSEGTGGKVADLGSPVEDFAGLSPSLPSPQLIKGPDLEPLLSYEGGVLIGELLYEEDEISTWIMVLADPDLIANHNLDEGDNAVLAVRMVERIQGGDGTLVFIGRGAADASFWQRLFMLPYAVITLQVLLALIVVVWAGVGRFGSPVPVPSEMKAGRSQLIDNAADLLDHARHGSTVLDSYARHILRDVAEALNAPRGLGEAQTAEWLDEAARQRGKPADAVGLHRRARAGSADLRRMPRGLVRTALDLYRWKRDLTDDTGRHPRA